MRPALFAIPLAIFIAGAALMLWRLETPHNPRAIPSPLIDKPAPTFALPPLEGRGTEGFSSADLAKGEVTLVNAWASWCAPCRIENAVLLGLQKRGVKIHGLVYKDKPEAAREFLRELGDPFDRVGFDEDGRVGIDFGLTGVPETYVVDGRGTIVLKHTGPLDEDAVERVIMPAINAAETKN